jgi:hypothetical protein
MILDHIKQQTAEGNKGEKPIDVNKNEEEAESEIEENDFKNGLG